MRGYRTTDIYAKYDPRYLSIVRATTDAVQARIKKRTIILPTEPTLAVVAA